VLSFNYQITTSDGVSTRFELEMSELLADIKIPVDDPPEWAWLKSNQCTMCKLHESQTEYCPAVINLIPLVNAYADVNSFEKVRLEVTTPERGYWQDTTLASALRSMMGLLVAGSACPSFVMLKPMARFHLPGSTELETIVRMTSFHLLSRFLSDHDMTREELLAELRTLVGDINTINASLAKRLRVVATSDSVVNAIIQLDSFASTMTDIIDESFEEIAELYLTDSNEDNLS
jgi:hypothetical protein